MHPNIDEHGKCLMESIQIFLKYGKVLDKEKAIQFI